MNIVQLTDGLGNQLFQYAFALALQNKTGREVFLDRSWFPEYGGRLRKATPRTYGLGCYSLRLPMYTPAQTHEFLYGKGFLGIIREKLHCKKKLLRESRMSQSPLACADNTVLKGFFQQACYADSVRALLLEDFSLPAASLNTDNLRILNEIKQLGNKAVFVHIRRGDYVNSDNINVFGVCSAGYYAKAEALIADKVGHELHLFIFSDDPQWVKENYRTSFPFTCVDINGAESAHLDINLMSHCSHAIIANSTFSWWGAWLISNPDKIVVAPSSWRVDGAETKGLIPDCWITC